MLFTTDYYAYEYGVMIGLTNTFKDIQLNLSSETYTAYTTKRNENTKMLEQTPIMSYNGDRILTFKMPKDFSISIKEDVVIELYNKETPIDQATSTVSDIIKAEWLKIIIK